jgi:hypothetical protein
VQAMHQQPPKQPVEFDQAINYVNKIKVRFRPKHEGGASPDSGAACACQVAQGICFEIAFHAPHKDNPFLLRALLGRSKLGQGQLVSTTLETFFCGLSHFADSIRK